MAQILAAHGCEAMATGAPSTQSGCRSGEQVPQSRAQLAQLSPASASQTRLPHDAVGHTPQSAAHELHDSEMLHTVSPQDGHALQSAGHAPQLSEASHAPSPQIIAQVPQSAAQLAQLSEGPHVPSPHATQEPQSLGHAPQLSVPPHTPSPHPDVHAQSVEQVRQLSSGPHTPSPHAAPDGPHPLPHSDTARPTHTASHRVAQQPAWIGQTIAAHGSQYAASGLPVVQTG